MAEPRKNDETIEPTKVPTTDNVPKRPRVKKPDGRLSVRTGLRAGTEGTGPDYGWTGK
jgi:hypothetical protein